MVRRKAVSCFRNAALCFLFQACSILLMRPLSQGGTLTARMNGALFWLCTVSGFVYLRWAAAWIKTLPGGNDTALWRGSPVGLLAFRQNKIGLVCDAVLAVSVVTLLVCLLFADEGYYLYILISLVFLSLNLHGLFNGRVYKFLFTTCKRKKERISDEEA